MRLLLGILFLLSSLTAFSSTRDSESFTFSGQRSSHEVNLSTEKTHTEYRWERRAETCYRRVYAGDRYVCRTRYRQVCRTTQRTCRNVCSGSGSNRTCRRVCTGGTRTCRQEPYRSCRYEPYYRQEPYTCYRDVRVPYEVFDYYVNTNVKFEFANARSASRASESFTAEADGDAFTLKLNASGKYIVLADKTESDSRDGDTLNKVISYKLKFVDFEKVAGAFATGYQNFTVDKDGITFEMDLSADATYKHFLQIKKRRFLRRANVLFNNNLSNSQISNDNGVFRINFSDLGQGLEKGRYNIRMVSSLEIDSRRVLNRDILRKLKTDKNMKFKLRKNGSVKIK